MASQKNSSERPKIVACAGVRLRTVALLAVLAIFVSTADAQVPGNLWYFVNVVDVNVAKSPLLSYRISGADANGGSVEVTVRGGGSHPELSGRLLDVQVQLAHCGH
jgi:hypothetical protein